MSKRERRSIQYRRSIGTSTSMSGRRSRNISTSVSMRVRRRRGIGTSTSI